MKKIINKSILNKTSINIYHNNHDSIYSHQSNNDNVNFDLEIENIRKKLNKKKPRHMIHTGIICDAYPFIEEELEVTKKLLDIVYDYAYGISIYTKSNLILRDIQTLDEINKQKRVVVMLPITSFSDAQSKLIDPNSATTKERVNILNECAKREIDTVVWITPILPYINDNPDNIKNILQICKKTGVKAIITLGLGLELEDESREFFFKNISKNFPGVKDKYVDQFSEENLISTPKNITLENIISKFCLENNIIYGVDEVFEFINEFPQRKNLFDF